MSLYINAKEPIGAAFKMGDTGCCGGGGPTGAAGAAMAETRTFDVVGGRPRVLAQTAAAAAAVGEMKPANGSAMRTCRCWWVAIAAVVVIALVARSS